MEKMSSISSILVPAILFIVGFTAVLIQGKPCGGSLQANEGTLRYDDEGNSNTRECVWILRLLTTSSFAISVDSISGNASLGLFSTEQAGSTAPVIEPRYRLNESSVDSTVYPTGEVIIVVLNSNGGISQRQFQISWEGLVQGSNASVESSNYLDSDEGDILENDGAAAIVAYVLNPPNGYNLHVEASVIGFENGCADLAYSIFEINLVGNLREIARTCGRPVLLQNLRPPIIALVAKVTSEQSEVIRLHWTSIASPPTTTVTPPPSTTVSDDYVISDDVCNDILVGRAGEVNYYDNATMLPNQKCVYTIRVNYHTQIRLNLTRAGTSMHLDIHTIPNLANPLITRLTTLSSGQSLLVNSPIAIVELSQAAASVGFQLLFSGEGELNSTDEASNEELNAVRFSHYSFVAGPTAQNLSYPFSGGSYSPNELTTIVLVPPHRNTSLATVRAGLTYSDIEYSLTCVNDTLIMQAIVTHSGVSLLQRVCQENTSLSYLSPYQNAIVLVFKSDENNQRNGFQGSFQSNL